MRRQESGRNRIFTILGDLVERELDQVANYFETAFFIGMRPSEQKHVGRLAIPAPPVSTTNSAPSLERGSTVP
jgi:hypothetical protein